MRKRPEIREEDDQNPFSLSIGDMMSALMFVFVLLLTSSMMRSQQDREKIQNSSEEYIRLKAELYIELRDTFAADTARWQMKIDSAKMLISFADTAMLFDNGSSAIKPRFKNVLDTFFPKYIRILSQEKYRDAVEEIRLEGHTDSLGLRGRDPYEYNMELSQDRTRSVLNYCLGKIPDPKAPVKRNPDTTLYDWTRRRITANGLSFSRPILKEASSAQDRGRSRRVEFRVRTNADKKLDELANGQ